MGFIKNRIKKYVDNIIGEVIDEKYNNGDFCQHDWELIMTLSKMNYQMQDIMLSFGGWI